MDHAVQSAPSKPAKPSKRKCIPEQLAHEYAQGKTTRELGAAYGVSHTTIQDWLSKVAQEKQSVERFRQNRADILARIQSKALVVQEQMIDDLIKDGLANTLTPAQKQQIMFTLNTIHGTLFDKERLERGQSTANLSVLSRMIDDAVTSAHQRRPQHIEHDIRSDTEKQENINEINSPNV